MSNKFEVVVNWWRPGAMLLQFRAAQAGPESAMY